MVLHLLLSTFAYICLSDTARICSWFNGNVDHSLEDFAYQLRWNVIDKCNNNNNKWSDHWSLSTELVLNLIAYWLKLQSILVFIVCHSHKNRLFPKQLILNNNPKKMKTFQWPKCKQTNVCIYARKRGFMDPERRTMP